MRAELLDAPAPAWNTFLGDVEHDVYHLPGYVVLSAELEAAENHATARAIVVADGERALLLPVIVREIPRTDGLLDAISPYGYPGPLWRGIPDAAFRADALAGLVDLLRDAGVVSLFVRTHPLLNPDLAEAAAIGTVVEHGHTVSIDLTSSSAAIWSATRPGHRSDIQHAIRDGARAFLDEGWTHAAAFTELYLATMERLGASEQYRFGADYLASLRAALGPRLHLGVVEVDGRIAAAALFTESCGIVQYHLSASDPGFARLAPTKVLIHHAREAFQARGDRVMHLGGGLESTDDSLFWFKAGFSDRRHVFRTWRVIVDPERYASLAGAADPAADPTDVSGFFPIYRRGGRP